MDKTNEFYNDNAEKFFTETAYVSMDKNYGPFLKYIPSKGTILDAGCGSGKDSLAFKDLGYTVVSIDGSRELCKLATEHIGQEVKHMKFEELEFENEFDGIWACATLLHIPSNELPSIITKLETALKTGGVLYASFKYGGFEGERNGRYFCDLTEDKVNELFIVGGLKIEQIWTTSDVREGREDEKWINLIVRKN